MGTWSDITCCDRATFHFLNMLMYGSGDVHISLPLDMLHGTLREMRRNITAADWLLTSSLFHKAFTQNGSLSRSLINTHIRSPYLPCLLQLGCPPLLQDGLHGTDEFCSDILENNRVRYLLVRLCLGNWASVTPLLLFAKGVCVGSFDLCASIHWVNDKELQFGLKLEHVLPYKQSSITKTYCVHYCWDHWGLTL